MKPEGVSQEVWEAAFDAGENAYMAFSFDDAQAIVARAIMAAEKRGAEQEREACADLVEGSDSWVSRFELAAAIRNRGKP